MRKKKRAEPVELACTSATRAVVLWLTLGQIASLALWAVSSGFGSLFLGPRNAKRRRENIFALTHSRVAAWPGLSAPMGGGDIDSEVASVRFGFYTEMKSEGSVSSVWRKIARKQQPWLVAAHLLPPCVRLRAPRIPAVQRVTNGYSFNNLGQAVLNGLYDPPWVPWSPWNGARHAGSGFANVRGTLATSSFAFTHTSRCCLTCLNACCAANVSFAIASVPIN